MTTNSIEKIFTTTIGVDIKGEMWSCVEVPDSAEFFGTKKSQRADVEVDGLLIPNMGLMVTGKGGHMFSLNASLRKKLAKDIGDTVAVKITKLS